MNAHYKISKPENEPIFEYLPGSSERSELKQQLKRQYEAEPIEIPLIIGGKVIKTNDMGKVALPHEKDHILATYHKVGKKELLMAVDAALEAKKEWQHWDFKDRASVFMKAADLLSGPYRAKVNAATMLNLSKNVFQAEIDSAAELIDFLRFNTYYAQQIYHMQPVHPRVKNVWNRLEYRSLEGFILAITPFNFVSIMGNLPSAPAIVGNTILLKPASSVVYAAYKIMEIFQEAGLPPGIINFIPGSGSLVGKTLLPHRDLAGVHFTGSTNTFTYIWNTIGANCCTVYKNIPRVVGETGGKDFIFIHNSTDIEAAVTALVRGAFEYQGQKCSAASRAYIPRSIWSQLKDKIIHDLMLVKQGDVRDFTTLMNAVIDEAAFDKIVEYIEYVKQADTAEIIYGGDYNKEKGYFIDATVIVTTDPHFKTMKEEIFGPVLTLYIYPDEQYEETLKLCDETSPYGLTGSIYAQDRNAIRLAEKILTYSAGNFYINDKPTGAVVGQQPFGGARGSGTNDKAGSLTNIMRWVSPRTIKENFKPPKNFMYDYMKEE